MEAILSFFEFIEITRGRLNYVKAPVMILQSKNDNTVSEEGPAIIHKSISTPAEERRIQWFNKSGHELFRDCEREAAITLVSDYIMQRVDTYMTRTGSALIPHSSPPKS